MKGNIKDYFDFRKSERSGAIMLVLLILVTLLTPELYKRYSIRGDTALNVYKLEVEEYATDTSSFKRTLEKSSVVEVKSRNRLSNYHPVTFDPNTLDIDGWMKMGFSQKQSEVIVKYKYKIGGFTKKQDLQQIYIIDAEVYNLFEPFIEIKSLSLESSFKSKPAIVPKKLFYLVELNSADSVELLKVNGIGPVFARRIIEFRQKLKGFSSIRQLEDVYGMDSLQVADIQDQVFIDKSLVTQFELNTVSLNDLRAHPYFGYYIAKAIIDYRIQSGKFTSLDQLKNIKSISPEVYDRIVPYLSIN